MVLLCSFNCNGLKNVDNFQNFVSVLYEKNISFTMLQETFWDNETLFTSVYIYIWYNFYARSPFSPSFFFLLFSYLFITQINICVLYR
jgi:hypothetical protein